MGRSHAQLQPQPTSSWAVTAGDRWLQNNFGSIPADEQLLRPQDLLGANVFGCAIDGASSTTGIYAAELQAIAREVRRLDNIVSDFLRFARPRRYERRAVDLSLVIDETIALVKPKASAHELVVITERPLPARCDPDAVKQVLLNVLLNAVEASPTGAVQLDASRFNESVVIAVADRGPGVAESARRRVFDPFFSTKTRGTGLGLAVSKQIIDEHKGRIRLLRRRGGGTRVVIELPA